LIALSASLASLALRIAPELKRIGG